KSEKSKLLGGIIVTTSWFLSFCFSTRFLSARVSLAALAMLVVPMLALAQDTGYISGTVTDKSGAAVAGADVLVKNTAGSLTRTTQTNTEGAYVVPGLPGDTYDVTISAKGFQKFTAQHVVLSVAEK